MSIRTPLSISVPIVDPKTGNPTPFFQRLMQVLLEEKQATDELAESAVQGARQIISGGGLTGGGDLTADRTLVVGAGTGIIVNANDVAADPEYIMDTINSMLVAGTNITLTYNDVANTLTIAASGGGGGGLVLLDTQTASASADLRFTTGLSSTYDVYILEIAGIVPATNATLFQMQMSTNAGVSYDSSAIYSWSRNYTNSASAIGNNGGTETDTKLEIFGTVSNTAAGGGIIGRMQLYTPASTSLWKTVHTHGHCYVNDNRGYRFSAAGQYRSTTAVNALRFYFSSGNIASGKIRLYGVSQ